MEISDFPHRNRQWLIGLLAALLVGWLLYLLRGILAPVALAMLLAYIFAPVVRWLSDHRWPRSLAGALCLLVLLVLAGVIFALLVPAIHHELRLVASHVPTYIEKIQQTVLPWLERTLGWSLSEPLSGPLKSLADSVASSAKDLALPAAKLVGNVLSGVVSLLTSLVWIVLIPLFTYYFIVDYEKIVRFFGELVPVARREEIFSVAADVDRTLSAFLRGQGTVCLILAVAYALALSLVGVPAGVTIGVVTGLFNFVPYVGTATGVLLTALFLALEGSGWGSFIAAGGVFVVLNLLDGILISPRVLGARLGLAPVAVILAVLAFGELFGFLGVLLAVPLAAVGRVLGARALKRWRASRLYLEPDRADVKDAKDKAGGQ